MNQSEYDAERTANGDKRLINLLYQKIVIQQAEIEALKERLEETSQLYSKQLVKASEK
jgi:hypothetical protein